MAFIEVKECLSNPKQLIKLVALVVCLCITCYQLSECVRKMIKPPVISRYEYLLNDTLKYPSVTICRRPPYKNEIFPMFGIPASTNNILAQNFFDRFDFENYTIEDFFEAVSYQFKEVVAIGGYNGKGFVAANSHPDLEITSEHYTFHGKCHTVTPKVNSDTFSNTGGYYFHFVPSFKSPGRDPQGLSNTGIEIYIHDAKQILTSEKEQSNSYIQFTYLEELQSLHISLALASISQISTAEKPCVSDPDYSRPKCIESCFHNSIAKEVGCTVPWLKYLEKEYPMCKNYSQMNMIVQKFRNGYHEKGTCKCEMSCDLNIYTTIINQRKPAASLAMTSDLLVYFSSNLITVIEETISYDWNIFISDIGGSMGFLLGLSVIGILSVCEHIIRVCFIRNKNKGKNDQDLKNFKENDAGKYGENSLNHIKAFLADCETYKP